MVSGPLERLACPDLGRLSCSHLDRDLRSDWAFPELSKFYGLWRIHYFLRLSALFSDWPMGTPMSQKESDPTFRAFSKARGTYPEVWGVTYGWGLIWRPRSIKGFFILGIPYAFAFGWIFLLGHLTSEAPLAVILLPMVAVFIAHFFWVRPHIRRI
jgi:hypothetical protein